MSRSILLIPVMLGALAVAASTEPPVETEVGDLTGVYICDGTNPDGSPYQGIVHLVKHNGTYHLQWSFGARVVAVGLGIKQGDVLSVLYYSELPGVISYRIVEGQRLVGQWTVAGADGKTFSETLTKTSLEVSAPAGPPLLMRPPEQGAKPKRQQPRPGQVPIVAA
jgi:hypothetical protein